jgi:nucleoid DNA-binding protein
MYSLQTSRALSSRSNNFFDFFTFFSSVASKSSKMNKAELIQVLAQETDTTKAAACRVLNTLLETIVNEVAKKHAVQLMGFGTFKSVKRAARIGKNPRTGEAVKLAAATVPRFSAGAAFKAIVNKKR